MLFPFKRKNYQQLVSAIVIMAGVLLMISMPIIKLSETVTINGFITGAMIGLIAFIYLLDAQ